ncbi:hypothetical protein [Alicyclobacillus tolerans]|uniref:Uncharacterized protein n=1 Tax=Alicyclobacillus tolerans TaxID=90970 RepID=A0A1M6YGB3_9BACL|nr:hypothetical protein [Alicyclobacillus montanus]SHL17361.1 hypothetical protein SAMN05443507_1523 [Alicyclobacillus montanus]
MKILLTQASNPDDFEIVEMNESEVLQLLQEGENFIVSTVGNWDGSFDLSIMYYDDFIE